MVQYSVQLQGQFWMQFNMATSSFSQHAKEYAENVGQSIILVDGKRLASLMLEHNVGTRTKQTIELKAIDEDFFIED